MPRTPPIIQRVRDLNVEISLVVLWLATFSSPLAAEKPLIPPEPRGSVHAQCTEPYRRGRKEVARPPGGAMDLVSRTAPGGTSHPPV